MDICLCVCVCACAECAVCGVCACLNYVEIVSKGKGMVLYSAVSSPSVFNGTLFKLVDLDLYQ